MSSDPPMPRHADLSALNFGIRSTAIDAVQSTAFRRKGREYRLKPVLQPELQLLHLATV